jgi:hypothetical protein
MFACRGCESIMREWMLCEICGRCRACCIDITAECGHVLSAQHGDLPPCECGRCEACCTCVEGYVYAVVDMLRELRRSKPPAQG